MGNRARYGRRDGWRTVFDPELWRQALAAGTAGAVSMAILACAVALARDTTGHDWYAAAKLTATEVLIGVGFDGNAPTEYRTADGAVETVSRYELTVKLKARWAREDILAAAWDGAMLGALSGLGGALLCLVLIRRPREEHGVRRADYEPAPARRVDARERFAPPQARPEFAPLPPATTTPVRASAGARRGQIATNPSKRRGGDAAASGGGTVPSMARAMMAPTFSAASTRCPSARWAQPAVVARRRCPRSLPTVASPTPFIRPCEA